LTADEIGRTTEDAYRMLDEHPLLADRAAFTRRALVVELLNLDRLDDDPDDDTPAH
jgi:hypothetical protein